MIDNDGKILPCYFCSKWGLCPDCQAEFDAHLEALKKAEPKKKAENDD